MIRKGLVCAGLGVLLLATLDHDGIARAQPADDSFGAGTANEKPDVDVPDRIPAAIFDQMFGGRKFVGMSGLTWDRKTVTVAFEGGSDPLYRLVEQTANEWIVQGSPIRFSFKDAAGRYRRWSSADRNTAAAIRISFRSNADYGGYWSALGRLAESVSPGEPTMNLEGMPLRMAPFFDGADPEGWSRSYYRSVILHEFGHALGLSHEHFHPDCQKDLDIEGAVKSLMDSDGWSESQARFNVQANYYINTVKQQVSENMPGTDLGLELSDRIDGDSVMLYYLSDDLFRSHAASPCRSTSPLGYAVVLSPLDRTAFDRFYPQAAR